MYNEQIINTPQLTSPAVSVIIPLYNAEKYLAECLDSILAQTFKDFELIIVDDCSTDSSCEIVEKNYMPKFDGRLKLYHTEKNTGSGAVARNIGLSKAHGDYVYNMDNDDVITKTALEEMYNLAKEYDADVVYCEQFYEQDKNGKIKIKTSQSGDLVYKPTVDPQDIRERVQAILDKRYHSTPWLKLVRRNLLIEHEIFFPTLRISDDNIWTQGLVIYAKKILRVPNVVYTWRFNEDSISRVCKTPEEFINYYINPIFFGLKYLDKMISVHEFFKENPSYRYALLKYFVDKRFSLTLKSGMELTEDKIYQSLKEEFGEKLGEYDVLVSALCTSIFEQKKNLFAESLKLKQIKQKQENKKLLAEKDAEINRLRAALAFQTSLLPQERYAISVIIPVYNTAEYIGRCLESLLIQTFQDFEVIVVDDCSTDKSVEIVESYRPKFNGRLRLTKTEKNSGGGGYVPRNIGFKLARGNYVYFMDADDFLLGTALETFYTTAKNNAVDVVYTAIAYDLKNPNDVFIWKNRQPKRLISKVLEGEEYDEFLHLLAFEDNFTQPWAYFVRRDFLLQNNITFPEIMKAGDYLWSVSICCQTKKIFRLAEPLYFYNHYNINSVSRRGSAGISHSKWILAFVDFIKALNEMVGKIKFLSNNPDYVYGIVDRYFKIISKNIVGVNKSLSDQEIYAKLYYEFINNPSDLMVPFFFSKINAKEKELKDMQGVLRRFRSHISAIIDIKSLSANGDFQIISVSDDNAKVNKPSWRQMGGLCYQIESYVGQMEIVAKAVTDGQLNLILKSMWIADPENKSKPLCYWIDYTNLTVNGKVIFDKITPAWQGKIYSHNINVKTGDEIKIHIEWLPHRDNRKDLSDKTAQTQKIDASEKTAPIQKSDTSAKPAQIQKSDTSAKPAQIQKSDTSAKPAQIQKSEASAKPAQTQEPDAPKSVVQIQENNSALLVIDKFKNYLTARVDLALTGVGAKNLQIVSVSDDKAAIKKPAWLQKDGVCYQIESYVGNMEIVAKAFAGGQLNLSLKGIWVPDPEDKSKRLRYWIDFTKCIVNGEVILDKITPVWNGKPYVYNKEVKAGEEIKINLEWQPHRGKA